MRHQELQERRSDHYYYRSQLRPVFNYSYVPQGSSRPSCIPSKGFSLLEGLAESHRTTGSDTHQKGQSLRESIPQLVSSDFDPLPLQIHSLSIFDPFSISAPSSSLLLSLSPSASFPVSPLNSVTAQGASHMSFSTLDMAFFHPQKGSTRLPPIEATITPSAPRCASPVSTFALIIEEVNEHSGLEAAHYIRKSGEIRYSNMSFINPSQYYITQITVYNAVSETCRIILMLRIKYNIISVIQSRYSMARTS